MPIRSHSGRNDRRNVVRIGTDNIVWLETGGANPPDVLVESEYAPVFAVDLPLAQHRMRLDALPYAVEERIAQPLDQVHVALGPEVGARKYLAAVVSHAQMRDWLDRLAGAKISVRRIVPDATTIPEPQGDSGWSVVADGQRLLIRTRDGEAFATSQSMFGALWTAAGCPAFEQIGGEWPSGLPSPSLMREASPISTLGGRTVDLHQGRYSSSDGSLARPMKIAAAMLVAAGLAHTAVLALDTAFVSRTASQRTEQARTLLASLSPDLAASEDPAAALSRMLPNASGSASQSRFLPLLSRASAAMQPVSDGVALQSLSFDEAEGALRLEVEASDLPALERIERGLQDAGLVAESAGATMGEGRADASIIVRDGSGDAL